MAFAYPVSAGELLLDNSDRIEGELQAIRATVVVWKSRNFGTLEIKKNSIVDLVSSVPLKLRGHDGVCYWAGLDSSRLVRLECEEGGNLKLGFLEIKEALLFEGYRQSSFGHSGHIKATGYLESGQVEKQDWNIDFALNLRHRDFRHGLTYKYRAESFDDGPLSQRNEPRYQFDWFFAPKTYLTSSVTLLRDELRLVDKRVSFGAGVGYQFWENRRSALAIESGPQYLNEVVVDANDSKIKYPDEYSSWRMAFDGRVLLPKDLNAYSKLEWLQGVRQQNDWNFNSESGMAMPIAKGLSADLKLIYNYDNLPPEGVVKQDSRLTVGLGYQW
ncbi:DUF481 domain-containing protein [Agaribacterium haliotis]|uniref:DUF481 domain-containing protein n=1 Tax=Agaribacterium haliotis TaxID=2013869 RepID=UPI00195BB255|nr:DUF481 domain-containing protein [Agaribacterium haliotis]